MKTAFITGITGQDGHYLSKLLLEKGYEVHGLVRRSSTPNDERIKCFNSNKNFFSHQGDLSDSLNLCRLIGEISPDEIYNLGAMSHVGISFKSPEYTADVDATGALRLLEAIRLNKLIDKTKFYQASTSELYGKVHEIPQTESTPFHPRSPYGVAKLYAYWITVNYREAYNMFACNGILFNHESPERGLNFVTRKISHSVAQIKLGLLDCLHLGNLEAKRDWGFAPEFVEGMWKILQHDEADDFVLGTGKLHSVREFVELAFEYVGIQIEWSGKTGSQEEVGINKATKKTIVKINPKYYRPAEVDILLSDASKAQEKLSWEPKTNFEQLVQIMVKSDLERIGK